MFSPSVLAKSLTPRLMKSRKGFETLSGGSSHSCMLLSSDSESCISPLWEDEQVTPYNTLYYCLIVTFNVQHTFSLAFYVYNLYIQLNKICIAFQKYLQMSR